MIERFLKAKHWQLFLITFGLPFFIQITVAIYTVTNNDPFVMLKAFPVVMILFIGGFLGWFWSIGVGLQSKVPADVTMKVNKFKTFLIIPLIYMVLFSILISSLFSGAVENGESPSFGLIGSMIGIIIPLHLFVMFCIFYCLYFVAKTIKTVELQREVVFEDFAGEFFLIWFYPIGIWIVQPKINKMVESHS